MSLKFSSHKWVSFAFGEAANPCALAMNIHFLIIRPWLYKKHALLILRMPLMHHSDSYSVSNQYMMGDFNSKNNDYWKEESCGGRKGMNRLPKIHKLSWAQAWMRVTCTGRSHAYDCILFHRFIWTFPFWGLVAVQAFLNLIDIFFSFHLPISIA